MAVLEGILREAGYVSALNLRFDDANQGVEIPGSP